MFKNQPKMKFLLFAAFVASTSSLPLQQNGRIIGFNQNGAVSITGLTGIQFTISKELNYHNQMNIDVVITGPSMLKHFLINDRYCNIYDHDSYHLMNINNDDQSIVDQGIKLKGIKNKSQYDIFYDIVKKFEGIIDNDRFNVLLSEINVAVQKGQICGAFYDFLMNIDNLVDDHAYGGYYGKYMDQYGTRGQGMLDDQYGMARKFVDRSYYGNRGMTGSGQSFLGDYLMGYGRGYTGNLGMYRGYYQGLNGGGYGGYGTGYHGHGTAYGHGYGTGYHGYGTGYGHGYGTGYHGYDNGYGTGYGMGFGYRPPMAYGNMAY